MGIRTYTRTYPDLHHYDRELNPDGTEKHITLDGARFHVIGYGGKYGMWCSEKNCELNRRDAAGERFEER